LCYSFRLGSCRKVRVNPDVSIAAKARPEGVEWQGGEVELKNESFKAKRS